MVGQEKIPSLGHTHPTHGSGVFPDRADGKKRCGVNVDSNDMP